MDNKAHSSTRDEASRVTVTAYDVRRLAHHKGISLTQSLLLVHGARHNLSARHIARWLKGLSGYTPPAFPVSGNDIQKLPHAPSGKAFGVLHRQLVNWWLRHSCRPSKEECLARAKQIITTEPLAAETSK